MIAFLHAAPDHDAYSRVERRLREEFGLYYRAPLGLTDRHGSQVRKPELDMLASRPDLAQVFLFHGDGMLREAALRMMNGPIPHPVVAYGIVARLNDWVPEVRDAAEATFSRCIHLTAADVLAPAAWVLMANAPRWRRWTDGIDRLVEMAQRHPGLIVRLVNRLIDETGPGTGGIFTILCLSPRLDPLLPRIAASARQPHLRARAVDCLSTGRAVWPLATMRTVWIDRSMNDYRLEPDLASRPISITPDLPVLIGAALRDRSVTVRKAALDALILHRNDPSLRPLIDAELAIDTDGGHRSLRGRRAWLAKATQA